MSIQNTRSGSNTSTSADCHQDFDLGVHLCDITSDGLKIWVSGATTARDNEKIEVKIVVKSVSWWDRWEEARVELVHSHRSCGDWVKCFSYEVKIELLCAE